MAEQNMLEVKCCGSLLPALIVEAKRLSYYDLVYVLEDQAERLKGLEEENKRLRRRIGVDDEFNLEFPNTPDVLKSIQRYQQILAGVIHKCAELHMNAYKAFV